MWGLELCRKVLDEAKRKKAAMSVHPNRVEDAKRKKAT